VTRSSRVQVPPEVAAEASRALLRARVSPGAVSPLALHIARRLREDGVTRARVRQVQLVADELPVSAAWASAQAWRARRLGD
jgi:hypothetical protein